MLVSAVQWNESAICVHPWRNKWQPAPVFLPGKSHGQRSLAGYSSWSCKELDMTEHTCNIYTCIPSLMKLPPRETRISSLLETDVCRKNFPPSLFLGSYSWLHFPRLFFRINPLPAYKSILLLSGERGCGKSTLLANWVNYFKTKYPNMVLIPHFVGSTCESSDIMSVIHYFITELQYKHYGNGIRLWNSFRKILFKSDHSVFCPRGYFSLVPI